MPRLLVLDTSVLVDLERGGLVEAAFRLPHHRLAVPGPLYRRELAAHGGPELLRLGLRVDELDGAGVALAQGYFNADRAVSLADAFALALAKAGGGTLLTGDAALRALAGAEGVACHGLLWLLDRMFDERAATAAALHRGLARIAAHPRASAAAGGEPAAAAVRRAIGAAGRTGGPVVEERGSEEPHAPAASTTASTSGPVGRVRPPLPPTAASAPARRRGA